MDDWESISAYYIACPDQGPDTFSDRFWEDELWGCPKIEEIAISDPSAIINMNHSVIRHHWSGFMVTPVICIQQF